MDKYRRNEPKVTHQHEIAGDVAMDERVVVGDQIYTIPDLKIPVMEPTTHYYDDTDGWDPNDIIENKVIGTVSTHRNNTYKIKELTFESFYPDFTVALYGKRRSGKTFFLRQLLWHMRWCFPECVIFTKTKSDREFADLVPDECIIEGLKDDVLYRLIINQYKKLEKFYDGQFGELPYEANINLLVVLDDCLADQFRYNRLIDELFFNGRHLHIMLIITTQDSKGLPPAMKGNVDMAVVWRQFQKRSKEAMREAFADFFEDDKEFDLVANTVYRTDNAVMAFSLSAKNISPSELIFAGVAPKTPRRFVLGHRGFWTDNENQLYKNGMGYLLSLPDRIAFPINPLTYNIQFKPFLKFFEEEAIGKDAHEEEDALIEEFKALILHKSHNQKIVDCGAINKEVDKMK